jgi:CheY-like chemotaxis protein
LLNLADVVSELSSMITCLAGAETQIVVLTSKMAGLVYADQGQMEQVLLNLVTNAHEAMPYGGTLTIVVERTPVKQASPEIAAGTYVKVAVQDTGSGIPPEVKARIFDPFFTTKPAGSGLGLSTVIGIVKQAGGHITVDSQPEQGSTFSIYLPVAAEVTVKKEASPERERRELAGEETILLVDDEEELSNSAAEYLEQCGYRVLKARAAEEAMQIARNFDDKISLLVTDIVMPGGSGRGLVEHIHRERPETGILVISGFADEAVRQHGFKQRTAFLQKPFTLQSLGIKIRTLLDGGKSRVRG